MSWIEQQIDRLMRGQPAGFREVLSEALTSPETLPEAIEALEEIMLESAADGRLTIEVLKHLPLSTTDAYVSPLQTVMAWIEDAEADASRLLADRGAAELTRIHDDLCEQLETFDEDPLAVTADLLSVLRVLTLLRIPGTLERLASAAQHPVLMDAYYWPTVFEVLGAPDHPWRFDIITIFESRWPDGTAQVAYLDHVNDLAVDGELAHHPFDSPRGHTALRNWLTEDDEALAGSARAATIALSFIDAAVSDELLAYAERHPEILVRIEAAAVRGAEGDSAAMERLVRWAADPRYAETAIEHLEQLGASDKVPALSHDRDFRAAAAMASWLAQPTEFNRPPDDLIQVDSRSLHWPPTEDRRDVWLFRYRYWPIASDETTFEGLGMVGSVTYAMADEDTEDLSVAEAYGLHCAWELEMMDDARAPPTRDPKAGLRILKALNPDL